MVPLLIHPQNVCLFIRRPLLQLIIRRFVVNSQSLANSLSNKIGTERGRSVSICYEDDRDDEEERQEEKLKKEQGETQEEKMRQKKRIVLL